MPAQEVILTIGSDVIRRSERWIQAQVIRDVTQPFVLALLVEGHGEVFAAPELIRRIAALIAPERALHMRRPARVNRSRLVKEGELERYVELAARDVTSRGGALLVLLDADDDCPAEMGPLLRRRGDGAPARSARRRGAGKA